MRNKLGNGGAECKPLISVVPEPGIEPGRPYERGILSPINSLELFSVRNSSAMTRLEAFVYKGAILIAERIFTWLGALSAPLRRRMYCSVMPTVVWPNWSRASRILSVDSSLSVAAFARRSRIWFRPLAWPRQISPSACLLSSAGRCPLRRVWLTESCAPFSFP